MFVNHHLSDECLPLIVGGKDEVAAKQVSRRVFWLTVIVLRRQ